MRVVAILAAYNEERFIGGCLEHLIGQGVEAYLIDNSSTDRTAEIARQYLDHGLVGIETLPREGGVHRWPTILRRKEEIAAALDADWFMHMDPDEIRLSPNSDQTLAEALAEVDAKGYNAVNFLEFTFVPTKESPEHDHPDFQKTMRWYYHFAREFPYQVKAWKRQDAPVRLAASGGHKVRFPGICLYPESFKMKHYQFLSLQQARVKYLENKKYDPADASEARVGWRTRLIEERMQVPSESELNVYTTDDELSVANPRMQHVIAGWALPEEDEVESKRPGAREDEQAPKRLDSPPPAELIADGQVAVGVKASRNDLPIVAGGCPGSGNSLLRQVLDAHPRIHCGPGARFFRDFHAADPGSSDRNANFAGSARKIVPDVRALNILGRAFLTLYVRAAAIARKPRFAVSDPDNATYLDDWQALLNDNWLFVYVVRNPLDTLAAMKERGSPDISQSLDERIERYKRYTKAGLEFRERHPDRYYCLQYEKLVRNPNAAVTELMNWLDDEFAPRQLAFSRPDSGAGEKAYPESVGRWKDILTKKEAARISEQCDPLWWEAIGEDSDTYQNAGGESPVQKGLLGRLRS